MRVFKKINGEKVNVESHIRNVLDKYPNAEIHVGTDSQILGHITSYASIIAFRYNTRGVHYIVHKEKVKRNNDIWSRLWKEAEMSIEISEWITSKMNVRIQIDMDYNENEEFKSQKLVQAATGWATSLGYKVNIKPNNQLATKAADYHCR